MESRPNLDLFTSEHMLIAGLLGVFMGLLLTVITLELGYRYWRDQPPFTTTCEKRS